MILLVVSKRLAIHSIGNIRLSNRKHIRVIILLVLLVLLEGIRGGFLQKLPALSLLPSPESSLDSLAKQWLESLSTFASDSACTGVNSVLGCLQEASSQEAVLLQAIEELAAYYGFISKRYKLDQIKIMHSFSSNLEIVLPYEKQNFSAEFFSSEIRTEMRTSRGIPEEITDWNKREVLFITPISGEGVLDIVTLLLFLAKSFESPPPLPVRLVFLGSEFLPKEFSLRMQTGIKDISSNIEDYFQEYKKKGYSIGSRTFLHNYLHVRPYGAIYLYHLQEPLPYSKKFILLRDAWFWAIKQVRLFQKKSFPAYNRQVGVELLYHSAGQRQTPVPCTRYLAKALKQVELSFSLNNQMKLSRAFSQISIPGIRANMRQKQLVPLLDPYLEKQWPIAAIYQKLDGINSSPIEPNQWANHVNLVREALEQFVLINMKAAVREQMESLGMQSEPTEQLPKSGAHYWLWNIGGLKEELGDDSLFYISERQIVWLVLLAIILFAISSFQIHWYLVPLYSKYSNLKLQSKVGVVGIAFAMFLVAIGFTLLANEMMKLLSHNLFSFWFHDIFSQSFDLSLVVVSFLQISLAILSLYGTAFVNNLFGFIGWSQQNREVICRILPYISQFGALSGVLFLLGKDFSLVVIGLYILFLYNVYSLLWSKSIGIYNSLILKLLQYFLRYGLAFLFFLPYIFLFVFFPDIVYEHRSYTMIILLSLPGLLLHFKHAQSYHLLYPYSHARYLLKRLGFCTVYILASIVLLYFLVQKKLLDEGIQKSEIILNTELHLKESYVLNSQDTGYKILNLHISNNLPVPIDIFESDSSSRKLVALDAEGQFKRLLSPQEKMALIKLGQELFSEDGVKFPQGYSSSLQLQTDLPFDYFTARVRSSQLLFANFPFSIPLKNSIDSVDNSLVNSYLLIGVYPPDDLRIELLSANRPKQLFYSIGFRVSPNMGQDETMGVKEQPQPIADYLLPLLSQVEKKDTTILYTLKHSVELHGLNFNF